ncbi:hypothetical protein [Agromyces sp. Marseille-P2726]|uniref:hypothetical protein n=1 Tax=Agromyces sp. Marseille-P2726 TaxID=2709132 RepID=UPI00156DCE9A|nr:hypothetical protein [Agromyces sp. Marseille-P2726]
MSRDGSEYEYPDEAGDPDGMGTLHEGTDDAAEETERELDHFAMEDEEDDDVGV